MPDIPFMVSDKRRRGYFTVDNVLIDEYGKLIGVYGLSVYICLARFADKEGECFPSFETIAKRVNMSRRQVIREMAKLVELELVTVTPQYDPETKEHKTNLYTLLDVTGSVSQSPPPSDTQSSPSAKRTPRRKQKKNVSLSEEERRRKYIPEEYKDIILG